MKQWLENELERVLCDICRADGAGKVSVRPDGLSVVECPRCGLCYVNPRPKTDVISRLYNLTYFNGQALNGNSCSIGYADYFSELPLLRRIAAEKFEIVDDYINVTNRRCLEIGCATGEFTALLGQRGARTTGIDLSAAAIDEAKRRYQHITFCQGDIESVREQFDVIFGFEVIEHVPAPTEFLKRIAERLTPNGMLFLSTPNYLCGQNVGLHRWAGFLTSFEHLYFFTAATLSRCGEVVGLETVDWLTDRENGIFQFPHLSPPATPQLGGIRAVLQHTHLLETCRRLKRRFTHRDPPYVAQGTGHNLLMVFKKRDAGCDERDE